MQRMARQSLSSCGPDAAPGPDADSGDAAIKEVARGGALNLVGNAVYGGGNFLLLAIVTTQLGTDGAGVFLVAIALFNIVSKICECGAATGLIRSVSRDRALGKQHELRANTKIAVATSFVASFSAALLVYVAAPHLADVFARGNDVATVTEVLRAMSPFMALASVYSVLIYGSRGFNTMIPQVCIEKIGRALAQPIAVLAVFLAGGGVLAGAVAWAAVQCLWVVPAGVAYFGLLRRVEQEVARPPARVSLGLARSFLSYSLPRALGQVFQVAVLWMDTLIIAAILGTTAAGIYAAGTRYLLLGIFTAEAIMQVLGPRISGLLAVGNRREAARLYSTGTAWQTTITWSFYLIVAFFSVPLLRIFGAEYVSAGPALVWLAVAMLLAALCGPSDTIILMSGRARLSLFNAFIAVGINVVGNFLLVPHFGITAAGATWAVTLVVAAALPAYQAHRHLAVHAWSPALRAAVVCCAIGVGLPVAASWVVFGPSGTGLAIGLCTGALGLLLALWRFGAEIHLDTLLRSFLPARRERIRAEVIAAAGTAS
jgi:O-antigen/teichoic acid export membrane protein